MNVAEEVGRFVICVVVCAAACLSVSGLLHLFGINEALRIGQLLVISVLLGVPAYLLVTWRRRGRGRATA